MDAGEALRAYGLENVADLPVNSDAYSIGLEKECLLLVACDAADKPIGFAFVKSIDGQAHLKEISVLRRYMRQGIGKQLLGLSEKWARDQGYQKITLTTYEFIPFNAPFYESMGYTVFTPSAAWPALLEIRQQEKAQGLDRQPRVCMFKTL
ncbi:GNAT family N-acetyltransferase [Sneathiella aquimaris]|uniref:GNAT family N-acetyltransferase n=1 Tax=Sneathiella aquimaris TaxID=2599305 RepID=UPI001469DACB|nr:GNAT family N-acetyltransferase [Sneathiella aquimaris]